MLNSLSRLAVTSCGFALLSACNIPSNQTPSLVGTPTGGSVQGTQRCQDLALQLKSASGMPSSLVVKTAYAVAGVQAPGPQWRPPNLAQGPDLPAHCVVSGAMNQRIGVGGKPFETRFELRLPDQWNGRLLYQGGGGNDGIVNRATGRNAGGNGDYQSALSKGYAAVTTDAGHQGPGPEFGVDQEARIDKAYAAHDRVARTTKALIASYYGQAVGRSYFLGCSGGGRQGMMFAQRYPEHFDGIISVAPAMSVASKATAAAAWDTQLFLNIAPKDANGQPILSKAFSNADLALVAKSINTSCDAQDGLADGMVNNVKACRFDPAVLQCAGAKTDSCLSAMQVTALASAFQGPRLANGRQMYVGQPWDPGIASPGWRGWKLGNSPTSQNDSNNIRLMGGALGGVFSTPVDPRLNTTNFNLEKDFDKFEAFSAHYDTFRDDKMHAFFKRGAKFMIVHGMADGIFSASESMEYFERLAVNNGGIETVQDRARLFLVPGMNHCFGGAATDTMDAIQAMQEWVEKGQAPKQLVASAAANHPLFPNRSRPLCPYPSYAKYNGVGNSEQAQSFSCEK
jgi:pimeloyl-ACP methyl ester carboxylesterase